MASSPKKGKISVVSTSKQEEATSSCCSPPRHDVFLSFRGDDTRLNFTAHLHFALKQRGINAYLDDTDLQRGNFIESTLWKAIEESRFSIVVFSKNYASSSWCLDELVKIVQCKEEKGHTPLPVFYDVDPSEVAQQTENYGRAFVKHQSMESPDKVQSWKDSLATVAKLAGWDVRNRNEPEIIRVIVEDVSRKLSCTISRTSKDLVGIERRIKQFNGLLDEASNDTHFIGIFGMGGLGKTTLARAVYERIHSEFEAACFLANVREVYVKDGVIRLQEKLLSTTLMQKISLPDYYEGIAQIQNRLRYKKVLLILDDVDKQEQLEKLAAQRGWFGPGSRIIITSRNKQLLTAHGVTIICEAEKLNDDEALILFSLKAFKQDQPMDNYLELSKCIVSYADGLPLALEVIGLFLHGRNTSQWKSEINKLKESPKKDIFDVLRISFDGLDEMEKEIFLDIACFFKGMKEDRVTRILDSCGFSACIGIGVLIERSLITVSQNELWMHDLLQIMGRKIVDQESPKNPSERSRLWKYKDVFDALINSTGRAEVESILLDLPKQKEATWNMDAFSKWSKLRLIKIHNVQLCQGPEHLSNELRLLEWHAFPSKSLPVSFQPDELVELDMSYSNIEQLWYGFKSLVNLKIINLSHSLNLTSTPDFTGTPNLEKLTLEGCKSLFDVHPSISLHKKLKYMNLVGCQSLRSLPCNLKMESLKVFTLNGCSRFDKFPDIVGNMDCLLKLRLDETAIKELPSSIQYLSGLVVLGLNSCKNLERLPSCLSGLKSLKKLDVSFCSRLQNLPEDLGNVECLQKLDASGTAIRQVPESIFLLKNMKALSFDGCENIVLMRPSFSCLHSLTVLNLSTCNLTDGVLPETIGFLTTLRSLDLSRNKFRSLPKSISQLSRLETLVLEDCRMLQSLPEVPSNIQNVNVNGCISLKQIPDQLMFDCLKRSEFKCLNCWELYDHNGSDIFGDAMLERFLKGVPNHRPGFSIVVPGRNIPHWFIHLKEGSSINIEIPPKMGSDHNGWFGVFACVAFGPFLSPSSSEDCGGQLYCHFKTNGREDYPSNMWISWSFIQVLSDHLWLFSLSFDNLVDWQHECVNNIELSFRSCEGRLKIKSCGFRLITSSSAGGLILSKAEDLLYPWMSNMLEHLPTMVAGVWSDDGNLQLESTTQFRKLLSIERSPPIKEVIQAGVVPRFVQFLLREDFPQLQFEAAWALTNIASGTSENTKVVIDHGAVPIFVQLLGSPRDDVREQAVWALGNVAGDPPRCRDLVLGHGALLPLLAQLNENAKLSMLRNATWTLSNFCRGKPQPPFDQVKPALPALARLIHSNDEEVLTDACWALSYLSDGANDKIQAVIEAEVCPRLVELLLHPSPSVLIPALRTVGNIVTGDDMQTQCIINHQALPCLLNLLTNNYKKSIKKEACLTISKITAGNKEKIKAVIEANIIGPLVHLLQNAEFDIKEPAAWAISNATSGGSHEQIKYLVSQGCIKPLCDLLVCPDPGIVIDCLEGLENILKVGEADKNLGNTGGVNLYAQMIDDAEGLKKIVNLKSHDNTEIYEKAVKILETYWLEEEDDTMPPGDASQSAFQFGGSDMPAVPSGGFNFS